MYNNIKNIYIIILWLINCFIMLCQTDSSVFHQNSLNSILLNEIMLKDSVKKKYSLNDYRRLEYRVLKVYPYVDTISNILSTVNSDLNGLRKKRLHKRYKRKFQKKLMHQFSSSVSDLTRKEGVILTKLIYREFDSTAYEMIVSYRGGVHAFFWHRLARLYDGDLKIKYNPNLDLEDFWIEEIIKKHFDK